MESCKNHQPTSLRGEHQSSGHHLTVHTDTSVSPSSVHLSTDSSTPTSPDIQQKKHRLISLHPTTVFSYSVALIGIDGVSDRHGDLETVLSGKKKKWQHQSFFLRALKQLLFVFEWQSSRVAVGIMMRGKGGDIVINRPVLTGKTACRDGSLVHKPYRVRALSGAKTALVVGQKIIVNSCNRHKFSILL